ncbi:MAG: glycosyltransferase family 4 protein [Myxococcales bacterium]|nr:glycosyltransferase family 4 protein [Myxococcales bacterium]
MTKHPIAFFTFNLTTYSGAARQALTLADHLEERPIFFNVEPGRTSVEQATAGQGEHTVIHLPPSRARGLAAVAWYTRRHRIRLYHLHGLVGVGLLAGLALRKPIVLKTTLLGSDDFDSLSTKPGARLIMPLVRRVDANIVLSGALEAINRKYLPGERVHRWPNAAELPDAFGPKGAPIFITVGLVCHRKRTKLAIQKFLDRYADLEGAKLLVIGPGGSDFGLEEGDQAYYEECLSLIPQSRRSQVVFTGSLSREDLQEHYRTALGFLSFSESEGMPNALLEAMAANCVPIVGEIGGVSREIIAHGEQGFVLGQDAHAPPIEEVRRVSESGAARARIADAFSFAKLAQQYAGLYRQLLG